ncbi:MAG: sulfurtransferase-like selenium metabolism protein YedF [Methylocystaceae bacterium]
MNKTIDARGLACPQPVVLTKREFDNGAVEITTLVDNEAARENLTRLGQSLGCKVIVTSENEGYQIVLSREPGQPLECGLMPTMANDVVLISSEHFGRGEADLGTVLMKGFLYALNEAPGSMKRLVFMNSGVKLTSEGSPVLDLLHSIVDQGIEVYSCGTCLDYHQLKDHLQVGVVTNMYSALEMMQQAGKVLTV